MALITPDRFNTLRTKIKDECARRSTSSGNNPISTTYQGTSYDYATSAAKGNLIKKEHYTKNSEPLNAINNTIAINPSTKIIESEVVTLEAKATSLAGAAKTVSSTTETGCASSCTGLCFGNCYGTCTSCSGCSGCTSCSGCSGCSGCTSCSGSCDGKCDGFCVDTCEDLCGNGCTSKCANSCSGCSGTCSGSCSGCQTCGTACTSSCSYWCRGSGL